MRILFTSIGSHGHTYPLIPLAGAALRAGHHVTYASSEDFHPLFTSLGFEPATAGSDVRSAFTTAMGGDTETDPRQFPPEEMMDLVIKVFAEVLPRNFATDLTPLLAGGEFDLVVYEAATLGGGIAARAAGVPALCHGFGRGSLDGHEPARAKFAAVAAEFGIELDADQPGGLGDPYLDIYPKSLQDKDFLATIPNRVELRPVPFAEPGELPAWVAEHREPLIYLTLGTAFGSVEVLRAAIDGLAALDARVLVAAGPTVDAAALGEVPDNVTVQAWVPQAEVLPHADLVVHHGGSGTTLGALAAGVPQLFLPQGADQFVNADAVTEGGAGAQLLGELESDAVTDQAKLLLGSDEVRARAVELAAEVAAMPSPDEVAARLDELV